MTMNTTTMTTTTRTVPPTAKHIRIRTRTACSLWGIPIHMVKAEAQMQRKWWQR